MVEGQYRFADILVDAKRLRVERGGEAVGLEPKSLRVLLHLVEHRDRVVGKEELIAEVWRGTFVTDNAVTRVIAQIRKGLGDNARAPRYIETVATSGYRFIAEVQVSSSLPPAPSASRTAAILLAIAGAAALLFGFLREPPTSPPALRRIQQITSSAAADLWPSFSPDGRQIAFSSNRTGHFQIYVRALTPGAQDRQITSDWQDNIQPAWSPDGGYLAFVAKVRGGIGLIPSSGGAVRYLTDSGVDPHWSPDGRTLVYRSGGMSAVREPASWDSHLMLAGVDGSSPRVLTRPATPPGGHNFPRFLPDGRHVVFTAPAGNSSSAPWMVDVATGETRLVPAPPIFMQFPAVAAGSRYLYFVGAGWQEPFGLRRARAGRNWQLQNTEEVIPSSASALRDLDVTPDGRRIVLSQETGESGIWSVRLGPQGRSAGEAVPVMRDRSVRNTGPSFSPDGTRVAYKSIRQGGRWIIAEAKADGSSMVPTIAEKTRAVPIWRASLSGPPERLASKLDLRRADGVQISQDGSMAAAHLLTASGAKIVVEDLHSGTIRNLTPDDRNISFPCWSPDGRWIAAQERTRGRSTLVIVSVDTGEIRTLVDEQGHSWAHDWSADGDRIAFAGLRDGVWNIYWVSRSTGHVEQLTKFTSQSEFVRYPAWSPKGDRVAFEYNELAANIYLAELR